MSKTKKLISLALTLLMVINIFSVVAFAEDDLADYSSLTSYIEKNVPINNDAGIYSAESYAPVENTLNSIDYELPASDQATVDGYLSTLQTAVAGLVADESKAVAEFSLSGTSSPLHPGDTVTVTFGLNTNYRVISAGAVIIFDSTKFELVGGSTINNNVVHYSEGVFSAYSLTGSASNTAKIFSSRNSNTAYWNTDEMKAQYTALSVGFSLNSKVSDPVVANGTVATITFRVLSEAQFGTEGSIFINSDFNKTSSFAGGLNYAARSVGEKMGPVSSTVTVGQTFDLDDAQLTLSVNHTPVTDSAVAPTCTETGLTEGSHCSVCGEVLTAQETVEALGHSWGEWAVTTAASCTEAGVETRVCANDENHTETRPVAALGHDYQAVVTAPTCTEGGYTTYTCSRCGDSYVADETEALGHAWNDGVVTTAPTCTQSGVKTYTCQNDSSHTYTEEITALGHDYVAVVTAPTCTEGGYTTYTCSRCGDSYVADETEALGHDYQAVVTEPTCTEGGYTTYTCSRCDSTYTADETEALGHIEAEWVVVTPATCTSDGLQTKTCSRCGNVYAQEVISALGHDYAAVVTAPTCTEGGYTTYTCSRGDSTYTADETEALGHAWNDGVVTTAPSCTQAGVKTYTCQNDSTHTYTEEIASLGHAWGDWTVTTEASCTEAGVETRVCANDETHVETRPVEALGHDYQAVVTEPTCTEGGYTTYTCSRCDSTYTADETEALGHVEAEWVVVTPATCTTDGFKTKTCSRCGNVYAQEVITALGHDYSAVVTEPTCTEGGYTTYTCSRGDSTYTADETEALGHAWGEWIQTTAPTCTDKGEETRICSRDDSHVETREVEALGHDYAAVVTAPTCTEGGYTTYTCSRGDSTYTADETEALGHAWGEWTQTTAPTCTEKGEETRICSRDDSHVETREVAALGHTAVVDEAVAPTCTETGLTEGSHCSVCGTVLVAQEAVEALGHDWGEWAQTTAPTCTDKGEETRVCSRDDSHVETREVAALGHDYVAVVTAPTCTATGYTTYTCSRCDSTYTSDETEMIAHTPGESAIEEVDGVRKVVVRCTVCGNIISVTDIGAADYTALNAAIAAAQAIEPVQVYDNDKYTALMAYIETVDMSLNAEHQSEVDAYTAQINKYMTNLTVLDMLRTTNATATMLGTTITLTITEGASQINVYASLKDGEAVTFSELDGPVVSRGGTLYSKVNGTATITLPGSRSFNVVFAIKDPAEDVADYSLVDAALAKAAAIKEEDVYDASTYTALETAVNAVVRGLREKDQATVNGYATAINNAYKNIVLVQDLIRLSTNSEIYKNGDTIVISLRADSTASYFVIYNTLYNSTDVTFLSTGKLTPLTDNQRYAVKQTTTARVLLENGKQYNILFIVDSLETEGYEALDAAVEKAEALNPDYYYDFSAVTAALAQVDRTLDEEKDIDTINYYTVAINDAIDSLQTVVSMLKLQNSYASIDGDTITVHANPGATIICIYKTLKTGEAVTIADTEGLTLYKDGSKYYTRTGGTSTLTLENGKTYNVVYSLEIVHQFMAEFVSYGYVDGTKSFDEATTTVYAETTTTIARIYKDAKSSILSINLEDYPFITESATFYQINSSALPYSSRGVANFVVNSDDGTDVNFSIRFLSFKVKSVLDYVKFGNATDVSLDGNVITVTLDRNATTKTYVNIPKTTSTGESVVVASDSTYVQNQNNSVANYILRYQAAGADITLTFDGVEYTLVYNVISAS